MNELLLRANCPSWPGGALSTPKRCREATIAVRGGVVVQVRRKFIEPPPRLRPSGCFAIFLIAAATPPGQADLSKLRRRFESSGYGSPPQQRRGGCAIKKKLRSHLNSRRRGSVVQKFLGHTTPSAPLKEASQLLLDVASTPPLLRRGARITTPYSSRRVESRVQPNSPSRSACQFGQVCLARRGNSPASAMCKGPRRCLRRI